MRKVKITGRKIAAAGIVAFGICLITAIVVLSATQKSAAGRDFIQYWALEQQLAHHANPYDPAAILRIERSVGMNLPVTLISLSPPVAWAYALPLGWMSSTAGLALWSFALLICMVLSVWLLWLLHGRPESRWHVIVLGFPPVLACLCAGQLGIFFLLEIVLFLYFVRRRPWLAGAALVLCALKPHLFLPFALVLLLWSASRRQVAVLGGFAAALALSCGLTLWIDPLAWSQYAQMMHGSQIMDPFLPTVGVGLRFLVNPRARWIEFIPLACACVWAAWYFFKRRERWDWNREGMLVLLVSVACTPYSWYCDQALLFPAVLVGLYADENSTASLASFCVIAVAGLIGLLAKISLASAFYIWTAPAWLLWYLYATRKKAAAVEPLRSGTLAAG